MSSESKETIPGKNGGTLTPFKKGQSGNPSGLPKGYKTFKTLIKEYSTKSINYKDLNNKKIRTTAGEALILQLFGKILYKGDVSAARLLLEHAEAKKLELSGENNEPIKINSIPDLSNLTNEELRVLAGIASKGSADT